MAGVGVSTTDRLQTPTTASAFHRQLHSRPHQPIEHHLVLGDVKVACADKKLGRSEIGNRRENDKKILPGNKKTASNIRTRL